jgi:hypothetical protein
MDERMNRSPSLCAVKGQCPGYSKQPVQNSPATLAAFEERLGDLGIILHHEKYHFHVGLCMMGWVMVVDDREPVRKVSTYPRETTATVLC